MSTTIGLPKIDIVFKALGASAVTRGERGMAVLILRDDTEGEPAKYYKTIEDFGADEQKKFSENNQQLIKDAFEGTPLKLYVYKLASEGNAEDLLKEIGGKIPRNCWIATPDAEIQTSLVTWAKAKVKNDKKRYKVLGHKATGADDMHIVNFTNEKVKWADEKRGEVTGNFVVPYLLGFLAGISINMSAIAFELTKFESVAEPEEVEESINKGEFVLFNDEGVVKVARAVNSLVTTGQDVSEEMCHINTVEKMDLIFCDIFDTWDKKYKGKYPNILDNQMLLISAINGYYKELSRDYILDKNFENKAEVDVEAQRLANYAKYGQETVEAWDDLKARKMTVGTKVFLTSNIKIAGIMEDFTIPIYM